MTESGDTRAALRRTSWLAAILTLSLTACGDSNESSTRVEKPSVATTESVSTATIGDTTSETAKADPVTRWYTAEHIERGGIVYADNCAACHGNNAEGTFDWRRRDANGNFPPPPLNGTAHAWHHPINVLGSQIKFGAPGGQGTMPGFAAKLGDEQIIDVIAWFQAKWPDEIYATWLDIEMRSRSSIQ